MALATDPIDPEPAEQSRHERPPMLRRMGTGIRRIGRIFRRRAPTEKNPISGLRVLIVTDAWKPQVNGVVRTLDTLGRQLTKFGNEVRYVTPDMFQTLPMPSYPEIRLAIAPNRKIARIINQFEPDAIHIATEGPLGLAARRFCVRRDHPFTTSFHTRFPEYLNARTGFPVSWGYAFLRRFHAPASALMVKTDSLKAELEAKGYRNVKIWRNGVDLEQFHLARRDFLDHPRPIWLYVGRVAVEKNIDAFLDLDLPGTKLVVGDGPQTADLKAKYPDAVFLGFKFGEELTRIYAASDVFVFPSKTDTFGLGNIEALACGIPVAAYDVQGPRDILDGSKVGVVSHDLGDACRRALGCATPEECRAHAMRFTWEGATRQFLENLAVPGYDEKYWLESANFPDWP
jgi:1,2-diacylglycerol 3-alpha-glucosyltransferase/glucuronosyltransferase